MTPDRHHTPSRPPVAPALVVAVPLLLIALGLFHLAGTLGARPGLDTSALATDLVDEATEAGFPARNLDPRDPLLAERIIVVTEGINERTAREVVQKLFHLEAVEPGRPIDLMIASPGGWVDAAFTIVDAMETISSPVNTHCLGGCYSAGSMILAAGTGERVLSRNALVMVHANREDSSRPFSFGRLSVQRFDTFYRQHADPPEEWFPLTGERTYYLSARQAVEYGLADRIADRSHTVPGGGTAVRP